MTELRHAQKVASLFISENSEEFRGVPAVPITASKFFDPLRVPPASNKPVSQISAEQFLQIEQDVRNDLARKLHDGPSQLLINIKMGLDFCQRGLGEDTAAVEKELQVLQTLVDRTMHQIRTMLFELRPVALERDGLGAGLEAFINSRQQEIHPTLLSLLIHPHNNQSTLSRQKTHVERTIFDLVQEAVNNAIKHAQTNMIRVQVSETPTSLIIFIIDMGRGFDVKAVMTDYGQRGSLGLLNMMERAALIQGKLSIKSRPDEGTTVTLVVPKGEEGGIDIGL